MPAPSKFTAERKTKILEALQVGASRRTAAAIAGIDHATLDRWIAQGKQRAEGAYHDFLGRLLEAEAHPKMRALGVIYNAMPDKPDLAWKFIERREAGFAPPLPQVQAAQAAPVMIHLSFHDGGALEAGTVQAFIEGEIVEPDEPAEAIAALPAPTPA